jgi:hypothetical protein
MRKATLIVAIAGALAAMMAVPALATKGDGNGDRIPDRWEVRHNLPLNVNQAPRDQDRDGLRNLREYREGTDPRDADSDDDGTGDRPECNGEHGGGHHGPPPPPGTEPPVAP